MALFVSGARLIPSALAALIGIVEPVLGPIWVWLVHGEVPGARTLLGGTIVFLALAAHLGWQFRAQNRTAPDTLPPGAA
jgi:drug/metabolite transporter (DMT)-like permease